MKNLLMLVLLGKVFIEHEIREQFQEIRDEIFKRKQAETKQARNEYPGP